MNEVGVSVVICTYNGATKLPETIKHIAHQRVPASIPWEFIIIDNASQDNTAELAAALWKQYNNPAPFRIISEPQAGLSYARCCGFNNAQYEFILMCDDDNWLNPDFIRIAYEIMIADKSVGALGGKGELVYEEEPPAWVRAFPIFASGAQAEQSGLARQNKLYGAGCVIRKSAYQLLMDAGYKSLLTDRLGKELSSGGDYELCYALVMAGFDLWYDERLTFKHFIPKNRFTYEYYIQYLAESSKCFEVLEPFKVICERKFFSFKSFRVMLTKILFYYMRRYAALYLQMKFYPKESVPHIIMSLRCYSIGKKIQILIRNKKQVHSNFLYGKNFQQQFTKVKNGRTVLASVLQAISS